MAKQQQTIGHSLLRDEDQQRLDVITEQVRILLEFWKLTRNRRYRNALRKLAQETNLSTEQLV